MTEDRTGAREGEDGGEQGGADGASNRIAAGEDNGTADGEDDRATGEDGRMSTGEDSRTADDGDPPLAAVVEKDRAERVIERLRTAGVYDDTRRVCEHDVETVSLPVTSPPETVSVREVVHQSNPQSRVRTLADRLASRGWSEAELERAPGSWAVIGSVVLVRLPTDCPDEGDVAAALLECHGEAETVLADEGVTGRFRTPRTRHLAGPRDTETIHVEAGTQYVLDPATVMFSPGNETERTRMGAIVDSDERVFDMFAGIGYFTLPMARAGARVTATERNPPAFRYLVENAALNEVTDRIDAYLTDCRELAETVSADRVVMGYYGVGTAEAGGSDEDTEGSDDVTEGSDHPAEDPSSRTAEGREFLPAALAALRSGGILHYHEATPEDLLWDRPLTRLETACGEAGRTVDILETRRVKSHSPGVSHVVVDLVVD